MPMKLAVTAYLYYIKFLYEVKQPGVKLLQFQHRSLFHEPQQLFRCSTHFPLLKIPVMHNSCRDNSCRVPMAGGAIVSPIVVTQSWLYPTVFY